MRSKGGPKWPKIVGTLNTFAKPGYLHNILINTSSFLQEYDLGQHVGNYHSAEDYKANVKVQSQVLTLIEKTVNQQATSTDSILLPQRDP